MWSFRLFQGCVFYRQYLDTMYTWWLIPLSKWVITPIINGISRVNPLITGVITHLLSGMSHQVDISMELSRCSQDMVGKCVSSPYIPIYHIPVLDTLQ